MNQMLDAHSAQDCGLVDEVVPDTELMGRGHALAESLAVYPPEACQHIKRLLRELRPRRGPDALADVRTLAGSIPLDGEIRARLQRFLDV